MLIDSSNRAAGRRGLRWWRATPVWLGSRPPGVRRWTRPDEQELDGCGGAVYAGSAAELGVPEGALRASMACGNPVAVAELFPGDRVLDLGSGGGLDVLLSARRVGPDGLVFGVDASPDMIDLARAHAAESGVTNVEFRLGYLEAIPLPDAAVDVVISNCVFTLSPTSRVPWPRRLGCCARAADSASPTCSPNPAWIRTCGRRPNTPRAARLTLTADEYRDLLLAAGFATTTITRTHPITGGLYSAIVQATTPPGPVGPDDWSEGTAGVPGRRRRSGLPAGSSGHSRPTRSNASRLGNF